MTEARAARPPIVGLTACRREIEGAPYHAVNDRYAQAVANAAFALPLLLPALGDASGEGRLDLAAALAAIDGLLVTGSPSNVEPRRYGGPASRPGTRHDPDRDATTLPLLRLALATGVPVLAICRGFQELNVALGGTLHQNLHELPGRRDHRAPAGRPPDIRYAPAHPVALASGSLLGDLARAAGVAPDAQSVNSLHAQGVDRLAPGLAVEAVADDGTIEAARVEAAPAFALGVQWHPEHRAAERPWSRALFAEFGAACRARAHGRLSR